MGLKVLKKLTWDDKWKNYVQYGQFHAPVLERPEVPCGDIGAILSVMHQLVEKMSVWQAYLKGVEFLYSSYPYLFFPFQKHPSLFIHKKREGCNF